MTLSNIERITGITTTNKFATGGNGRNVWLVLVRLTYLFCCIFPLFIEHFSVISITVAQLLTPQTRNVGGRPEGAHAQHAEFFFC